jgi:alkylresorcinol/alkylpyrone synthase
MPHLIGFTTALPKNLYKQSEICQLILNASPEKHHPAIRKIHDAAGVATRSLCLPIEAYPRLGAIKERMHLWHQAALGLGSECLNNIIDASFDTEDIGHFFFTSVTGMSAPSIDACLVDQFELSSAIKRTPIFGLGCLGGAALLSRAADYVRAYPKQLALVLAVELCSLTWQKNDISMANIVATGLFGDGSAALLVAGDLHPLAQKSRAGIIDAHQVFFPHSRDMMGWSIEDSGFQIVLSPGVPEIAESEIPKAVDIFLGRHNLKRPHIKHWIAHPGGPKVISALGRGLGLPLEVFQHTRDSLLDSGNMSSVSVLNVLERSLKQRPKAGDLALLFAMGPGFCAEMVLLKC